VGDEEEIHGKCGNIPNFREIHGKCGSTPKFREIHEDMKTLGSLA
jgi:hypothetical protein